MKATGNATAAQVLSGTTFSNASGNNLTGTMVNRGTVTSTITTQGGQYTIPEGYHNGSGKITASFANLVSGNVRSGVGIGGVIGTLQPSLIIPMEFSYNDYVRSTPYEQVLATIPSSVNYINYLSNGSASSSSASYGNVSTSITLSDAQNMNTYARVSFYDDNGPFAFLLSVQGESSIQRLGSYLISCEINRFTGVVTKYWFSNIGEFIVSKDPVGRSIVGNIVLKLNMARYSADRDTTWAAVRIRGNIYTA
ncbi:hypothetical protein D3C74_328680 [compost metagenome]